MLIKWLKKCSRCLCDQTSTQKQVQFRLRLDTALSDEYIIQHSLYTRVQSDLTIEKSHVFFFNKDSSTKDLGRNLDNAAFVIFIASYLSSTR